MFNEYFWSRKKESRPMLQGQKFIVKERNRLKISEAKREAQEWDEKKDSAGQKGLKKGKHRNQLISGRDLKKGWETRKRGSVLDGRC